MACTTIDALAVALTVGGMSEPIEGREPLHVAPRPCNTCPYRCDTPSGVWHTEEYEKLADYDTNASFATFLCHMTNATGDDTVCRGWLTVHSESVAARMAVMTGAVTDEERYAPVDVELYATGAEARDAGLAGISQPGTAAQVAITKLVRRGAARV